MIYSQMIFFQDRQSTSRKRKVTPAKRTPYRDLEPEDVLRTLEELVSWVESITDDSCDETRPKFEEAPISWNKFKDDEEALRCLFNAPSAHHIEAMVDSLYDEQYVRYNSDSEVVIHNLIIYLVLLIGCSS